MKLDAPTTLILCIADVNSFKSLANFISQKINGMKPISVHIMHKNNQKDAIKTEIERSMLPENMIIRWDPLPKKTNKDQAWYRSKLSAYIRYMTSNNQLKLIIFQVGSDPTLAYYLNIFLSLYGRESDELHHLISNQFNPKIITIPWLKLDIHSKELKPVDSSKATHSEQLAINKCTLFIDIDSKNIFANDKEISLSPALFCWYSWLAVRKKTLSGKHANVSIREKHHLQFMSHFKKLYGDHHHIVLKVEAAIRKEGGFTINYMSEKKTRINNAFSETLGIYSEAFHIQSLGERPNTQYSLLIEPANISINTSQFLE